MNIKELLNNGLLYFDGGTGTILQSQGLMPGELPETWNIRHPERITALHKSYFEAGCNIIKTNTFGANRLKFDGKNGHYDVKTIVTAAVNNAKRAVEETSYMDRPHFIALDLGPTGKLLKPLGDLDFEDAVSLYAEVVSCGAECGADLILIETMNDSYETKAAVLAAKENSCLPVFVTTVYDQNAKLMTGADPAAMIALLEGMKVDAIGMNCSLGPAQMKNIVPLLAKYSSTPIIVNPNAGLPRTENGFTIFDVTPEVFAEEMLDIINAGACIVGGCCGTTPLHIKALIEKTKDIKPVIPEQKDYTLVSSYTHAVEIGRRPVLIGERINPTGKPRMKTALKENNMDYLLNEAVSQQEKGVHILDVNVGLPDIDEVRMLCNAVTEIQSVTSLPLQLDTSDPAAMEQAMRLYNGKPMINSVNGKAEIMKAVFPLAAKYGGVIVALTLDENGIPETAEGRIAIADRIYATAAAYGISPKDIVVDPLALTISSDTKAAIATLNSIKLIKEKYNGRTSLGVSNISFGLPNRDFINSTFFAMALNNGLSAAIMNPYSLDMMKTYHSYMALTSLDENCIDYIDFASNAASTYTVNAPATASANTAATSQSRAANSSAADIQAPPLQHAITKGLKEQAAKLAEELLSSKAPLEIINEQIIPALDVCGQGFENGTIFLPQLLMSAEASKAAFDIIKSKMPFKKSNDNSKTVIVATVKNDIHDIGKNIVRVLLENYGFDVIDLGKDVEPELVVQTAIDRHVQLVGLSALMTTTVPSMEATIKLLRQKAPWVKTMVGGAVLNQEYADMIGADFYSRDAMESVRYAERVFAEK